MAIYELAMAAAMRASHSRARTAALAGVRDSAPILAVIALLGLLVGAAVAEAPLSNSTGWLGAAMIYAASAHLVAISLLGTGASAVAVVTAVLLINARGLVYSAALAPAMRGQPGWFRWTGPYFLVDPLFASPRRACSEPATRTMTASPCAGITSARRWPCGRSGCRRSRSGFSPDRHCRTWSRSRSRCRSYSSPSSSPASTAAPPWSRPPPGARSQSSASGSRAASACSSAPLPGRLRQA